MLEQFPQRTMTTTPTDWRALCAELLEALENAIRVIYHEDGTKHISTADAVIAKADAALRTAADHVHHHWDGMECVDYLCAIANELEQFND